MPLEITCACALCEIEPHLLASLSTAGHEAIPALTELSQLHACSSVADLVRLLRASPAHAESDALLSEIFKVRAARPTFIDSLLVLVFVPMLHRTVRRVAIWQPQLAEEDIVQQVLSVLLEFLRSDEMRVRRSHFAFAISRAVKRQVFAWAAREGTKEALLDRGGNVLPPLAVEDSFERYTQLRHFLHGCVTRGVLTETELNLLIQFKLEGASNGEGLHASNGNSLSNATRQRLKRLLAKLRRLAR
jgi:hypothetical protein